MRPSIEYAQSNKGKFLYAVIEPLALQLLADLRQTSGIGSADWTGTLRRGCEIIETAEFVTAATTEKITAFLPTIHRWQDNLFPPMERWSAAHWPEDCRSCFIAVPKKPSATPCFARQAMKRTWRVSAARSTGNASSKVQKWRSIVRSVTRFPEPELREEIWETRQRPDTSKLITEADLRGILHNHSTWSDGTHSLRSHGALLPGTRL